MRIGLHRKLNRLMGSVHIFSFLHAHSLLLQLHCSTSNSKLKSSLCNQIFIFRPNKIFFFLAKPKMHKFTFRGKLVCMIHVILCGELYFYLSDVCPLSIGQLCERAAMQERNFIAEVLSSWI